MLLLLRSITSRTTTWRESPIQGRDARLDSVMRPRNVLLGVALLELGHVDQSEQVVYSLRRIRTSTNVTTRRRISKPPPAALTNRLRGRSVENNGLDMTSPLTYHSGSD